MRTFRPNFTKKHSKHQKSPKITINFPQYWRVLFQNFQKMQNRHFSRKNPYTKQSNFRFFKCEKFWVGQKNADPEPLFFVRKWKIAFLALFKNVKTAPFPSDPNNEGNWPWRFNSKKVARKKCQKTNTPEGKILNFLHFIFLGPFSLHTGVGEKNRNKQ